MIVFTHLNMQHTTACTSLKVHMTELTKLAGHALYRTHKAGNGCTMEMQQWQNLALQRSAAEWQNPARQTTYAVVLASDTAIICPTQWQREEGQALALG